jgi:hypothetical protein
MKTNKPLYRSAVRVALGVAIILSLPLIAMQFSEEVVWSLADFVAAGALLATIGAAIELAVRRAGNLAIAIGIAVLGIAAGLVGQADDAPGLVLLDRAHCERMCARCAESESAAQQIIREPNAYFDPASAQWYV